MERAKLETSAHGRKDESFCQMRPLSVSDLRAPQTSELPESEESKVVTLTQIAAVGTQSGLSQTLLKLTLDTSRVTLGEQGDS